MRMLKFAILVFALTGLTAAEAKKKPKPAPIPIDKPSTADLSQPAKIDRRGAERGLGDVMGKGVEDLKRMFGEPRIDVIEVYGRKLQFSGNACILDAYLYPDGKNGAEVVTHVDARRSDGAEVDRGACVNALTRR